MKTPYERNGAKAKFDPISRWWYCHNCRKMQLGPYIPSQNPKEYAHPDAAKIYPIVSKIIQEDIDRSGYLYVNELNENAEHYRQRVESDERVILYRKAHGNYVKNKQREKQEERITLRPFWKCQECNTTHLIESDQLNEKSIEDEVPTHCETKMKLTIKPAETSFNYFSSTRDDLMAAVQDHFDSSDYEKAGEKLFELVLYLMEADWKKPVSSAMSQFLIYAKKRDNPLVKTWGFVTVLGIAQAFTKPDGPLNYAIEKNEYCNLQPLDFGPSSHTIDTLRDSFNDIIFHFNRLKPETVPYFRIRFNKILNRIYHQIEQSEKMDQYGIKYKDQPVELVYKVWKV